jgi:hypothetical protein
MESRCLCFVSQCSFPLEEYLGNKVLMRVFFACPREVSHHGQPKEAACLRG